MSDGKGILGVASSHIRIAVYCTTLHQPTKACKSSFRLLSNSILSLKPEEFCALAEITQCPISPREWFFERDLS